ncbi:GPCR fungal pheromone mating factor, partial [Mycena pura]
ISPLSIIAWLFVSCLSAGVNAIIWAGNTDVIAVWCDIVTKLKIGANTALPSCCLCLGLQLYAIAGSLKTPKRGGGGVAMDLSLCWGLPILTMALHYIVQGHRFDVIEDFGCRPTIYISLLSLLLVDLPAVVVSLLALIYCGLALFYFSRRRLIFTSIFKNTASDSALSTSRYLRLMSMTMVLGTWNATMTSIGVFVTYSDGLRPWTSWSDVHSNFSRIQFYSLDQLSNGLLVYTYLLWAAVPISSLLFFAFFSFGEDSKKEYGHLFRWIRRCVLQQDGASRSRSKY